MASIQKIEGSRFWYASYRDARRKQHLLSTKIEHSPEITDPKERVKKTAANKRTATKIATDLEEAECGNATEAHLRKIVVEVGHRVNQRQIEFKQTRVYLGEWRERASKAKSKRTAERYVKVVDDFLGVLGPKAEGALDTITPRDVQLFVDAEMRVGKGATSVRIAAKVLNIPFARAMRQGLIATNPVASVELPDEAGDSHEAFNWEQVLSLYNAADGEWKTAILMGAYTGARLGDVVNMRWKNIPLDLANVAKFLPSKTKRTRKQDLVVPAHPTLRAHLLTLAHSNNPEDLILPGLAAQRIPGRSGLSRQFTEILSKAGIIQETVEAPGKGGRRFNRFTFQSLRHTFVSNLSNNGVDKDTRKLLSGHEDDETHLIYTHMTLAKLKQAVETLPAMKL